MEMFEILVFIALYILFYVLSLDSFEDSTHSTKIQIESMGLICSIIILLNSFNINGNQNYNFIGLGILFMLVSLLNIFITFTYGSFEGFFNKNNTK